MGLRGKFRHRIFVLALILFVCGTVSCSWETVGNFVAALIPSVEYWEGETEDWTYNGTEVQYEVPQNVRTLNLKVNGPVDIFMVKMNNSSDVIPRLSTRYIVSATAGSDEYSGASYSSRSALMENPLLEMDDWENVSGISASGIIRKDYVPAQEFVPPTLDFGNSGRSAGGVSYFTVTEPVKSVTQINPAVNSTSKMLWVNAQGEEIYKQERATLRAAGKYCYIWVVDSYFSTATASGSKINST